MECRKHDQIDNNIPSSPSPEMFSFPGTPTTDDQSEFEFGSCLTPDSPPSLISTSDHNNNNNNNNNNGVPSVKDQFSSTSPADQFFLNGRLLPHDFPVVASTRTSFSGRDHMGPAAAASATVTLSRGTSNSSSSKDYSLVSSRSNSINSTCSSSSSSAAKTSSGDNKKPFQKRMMHSLKERNATVSTSPLGRHYYKYGVSGSSQRWQFITAVPAVLGHSRSQCRRGRKEGDGGTVTSPKMMRDVGCKEKRDSSNGSHHGSFFHKILRSVVATCKACHAMEGQEKEFELDAPPHVLGH